MHNTQDKGKTLIAYLVQCGAIDTATGKVDLSKATDGKRRADSGKNNKERS